MTDEGQGESQDREVTTLNGILSSGRRKGRNQDVDDVAELCQEFGFHFDSDDIVNLSILRDVITAAITHWRAPVAQFWYSPEPHPSLEEVVGYVMGGCEIDGKRIRLNIAVLEPCPVDEWRPIARKALKRLTAPPVAQPAAQPVNLVELRDPDFSDGLTPIQHLDVVHGGADPRVAAALAEAILSHPGFGDCHDGPVALPAQGEVAELVAALKADAECVAADKPDLMQLTDKQLARIAELLKVLPALLAPGFQIGPQEYILNA